MNRQTRILCSIAATCGLAAGTSVMVRAGDEPVVHTDFNPNNFSWHEQIDNRYLPLFPGTKLTYEGTVNIDGVPALHRIEFAVTDLSKTFNGVTSRVIYDVDSTNGVTTEAELAFMAQDLSGNVWNSGEYPEVFEGGQFDGAPATWIAGVDDALAGVGMRNRPRPATSDYFQGVVPSIEFGDIASIVGFVPNMCVTAGCFKNVLEIKETNTFEPTEGFQLKYYAPNVGNIRIDFISGTEAETMQLVKIDLLVGEQLRELREAARLLDKRAYKFARGVYQKTPRVKADHGDGDR